MRYPEHIKKGIDLRHFRYFLALAEECHFGRAAAKLNMAQPPLSQQIAQLEARLGYRLFERRPTVRLTAAGEAFLELARTLLEGLNDGLIRVGRVASGEEGILRIGIAGSVVPTVAAAYIRAFRRSFSDIVLDIKELPSALQPLAIREGRIDLGLMREPPAGAADFLTKILSEEAFVAVMPPDRAPVGADALPLSSLANDSFVLFPADAAPDIHRHVQALFAEAAFAPVIVQEAQEWLTIVGLVAAGVGVSVVPQSFASLHWGGVKYLKLAGSSVTTRVGIIAPLSSRPAALRFLEMPALQPSP